MASRPFFSLHFSRTAILQRSSEVIGVSVSEPHISVLVAVECDFIVIVRRLCANEAKAMGAGPGNTP